jgi:hypothetical protein
VWAYTICHRADSPDKVHHGPFTMQSHLQLKLHLVAVSAELSISPLHVAG